VAPATEKENHEGNADGVHQEKRTQGLREKRSIPCLGARYDSGGRRETLLVKSNLNVSLLNVSTASKTLYRKLKALFPRKSEGVELLTKMPGSRRGYGRGARGRTAHSGWKKILILGFPEGKEPHPQESKASVTGPNKGKSAKPGTGVSNRRGSH